MTAPLFIGPRLMAAVRVGDDGGTLHIKPIGRDHEDRVEWRYVIEDGDRTVLDEGTDLRSGAGEPVDPRKALATLVGFLGAAAEAYRVDMQGQASENAEQFPPGVAEWAYLHDDELASLGLDLDEPGIEAPIGRPSEPLLRPAGRGGLIPPGWTVETVGDWNGRETEVVYNPRSHDVMVVQSSATEDREGDLAAQGWAYYGTDGYTVVWVRDRIAAARTALDRSAGSPAPEVGPPAPEIGGL